MSLYYVADGPHPSGDGTAYRAEALHNSTQCVDGSEHYLWPVRDGRLSADMLEWNDVLQFYRGRNEHKVAFVKDGCAAL